MVVPIPLLLVVSVVPLVTEILGFKVVQKKACYLWLEVKLFSGVLCLH